MARLRTASTILKWLKSSNERGYRLLIRNTEGKGQFQSRTMIPAPRCPSRGAQDFSIIRTGTPFWRREIARTSPEGPPPTCTVQRGQMNLSAMGGLWETYDEDGSRIPNHDGVKQRRMGWANGQWAMGVHDVVLENSTELGQEGLERRVTPLNHARQDFLDKPEKLPARGYCGQGDRDRVNGQGYFGGGLGESEGMEMVRESSIAILVLGVLYVEVMERWSSRAIGTSR